MQKYPADTFDRSTSVTLFFPEPGCEKIRLLPCLHTLLLSLSCHHCCLQSRARALPPQTPCCPSPLPWPQTYFCTVRASKRHAERELKLGTAGDGEWRGTEYKEQGKGTVKELVSHTGSTEKVLLSKENRGKFLLQLNLLKDINLQILV